MPRHPEGRQALTVAERSVRKRARRARIEQQRLDVLRSLANDLRLTNKDRARIRDAIEGKTP